MRICNFTTFRTLKTVQKLSVEQSTLRPFNERHTDDEAKPTSQAIKRTAPSILTEVRDLEHAQCI